MLGFVIVCLLLGIGLIAYGWRKGKQQTTDGSGPWVLPMLFGAALCGIALCALAVIALIYWVGR